MMAPDRSQETVAVGSDHAGYLLKERFKKELESMGYRVSDMGTDSEESCDYPDFALAVAHAVSRGEAGRGVLICGTGAGMAMVANKVPGVRAVAANEPYTAEYCRRHNDANILTVGSRVIGEDDALEIMRIFMSTDFEAGRHAARLDKMKDAERAHMKEC